MVLHTAIEYMRNEARALYTIQGPGVTGAGRPWEEAVGTKELATGKNLWRRSLLAFGVASVLFAVVNWSWIDAQVRAVIVLSPVLEAPVLTLVVEALTGEPRFEDASVAGNPALVAKPSGEGPWPAVFFVNGVVTEGRELPEVRRIAEGLARAGYLVVVPDLPGLRRGEIRPETVHETLEVAREISERPDAREGGVGLLGVSTGATLALTAAGDGERAQRVSVVAGGAPYTDVRTVLSTATTGYYRAASGEMVPYEVDPFLAGAITQSLVSTLPPNRDPDRFDGLYAGLPDGVRAKMEKLSPLAGERRLDVPVELISGPRDKYFPVSESRAVVRIAPQARVTVSEALDHVELSSSARDLPSLLLIDGFLVRSLREARL